MIMILSVKSKKIFLRANLLCRRFQRCSLQAKLKLFRAFCICFYGTALWKKFGATTIAKFKSCYHKCLKYFFGYLKYSSVKVCCLGLVYLLLIHHCIIIKLVLYGSGYL